MLPLPLVIALVWILSPHTASAAGNANPIGPNGSQSGDGGQPFTALAGEPSAQLFTGTATTSIGVVVPPGRLAMTPSVSISYSSAGGPSSFGFGWSHSAGRIRRSTKLGVPCYSQQAIDDLECAPPVEVFLLEMPTGVQELVYVSETSRYRARIEGSYNLIGLDDNTWTVKDKAGMVFRFGEDDSWARSGLDTTAEMGTFAWYLTSVEDPYGNTIEYEYEPTGYEEITPPGLVRYIDYGGDVKGREHIFRVAFNWEDPWDPAEPGTVYPAVAAISHAAGYKARLVPRRLAAIETYAEDRLIRSYSFSHTVEPSSGLFKLDAVSLVALNIDGEAESVPSSRFIYSPTIQLNWPLGSARDNPGRDLAITDPPPFRDITPSGQVMSDIFDINGDGLPDIVQPEVVGGEVRLGTGDGFAAAQGWDWPTLRRAVRLSGGSNRTKLDIFDIDGDRLPDLIGTENCGANNATDPLAEPPYNKYSTWCVWWNTGVGFALSADLIRAPGRYIRSDTANGGDLVYEVTDLNNDGLLDYISAKNWDTNGGYWEVYTKRRPCDAGLLAGDKCGFDYEHPILWKAPSKYVATSAIPDSPTPSSYLCSTLVDMNGDGLRDYLSVSSCDDPHGTGFAGPNDLDAWHVYLNTGSGFAAVTQWRVEGIPEPNTPLHSYISSTSRPGWVSTVRSADLFDVTGDGLPDIVRSPQYPLFDWLAGITMPSCTLSVPQCSLPWDYSVLPPDCCEPLLVFVNTGSSFSAPIGMPSQNASLFLRRYSSDPLPDDDLEADFLDIDGDGLVDYVERIPDGTGGSKWRVFRHPASPDALDPYTADAKRFKPNLLVSSMNGLGASTTLTYAAISRLGESDCISDMQSETGVSGRCIDFPRWVFRSMVTQDLFERSPDLTWLYDYNDAYFDIEEREFRGFGTVGTLGPNRKSTINDYHQLRQCAGRISDSYTLGTVENAGDDPWSYLLGHEHKEWECDQTDPGVYGQADEGTAPTPVLLRSTTKTPWIRLAGGAPQVEDSLQVRTEYEYDDFGSEKVRRVLAAGLRTVETLTDYTTKWLPPNSGINGSYLPSRPKTVRVRHPKETTAEGTTAAEMLMQRKIKYNGSRAIIQSDDCVTFVGEECLDWATTKYRKYQNGLPQKTLDPGRLKKQIELDEYALIPIETKLGDKSRSTILAYDYGLGVVLERRNAANQDSVSRYDGLGRRIEYWGPGFVSQMPYGPIESWALHLPPVLDENSPANSQPAVVVSARHGLPQSATFYDGRGRTIATKTEVETYASDGTDIVAIILDGMKQYDSAGRVRWVAQPIDVTESDASLTALTTTFDDCPINELVEHQYEPVTGELELQILPTLESGVAPERRFVRHMPGIRATANEIGLVNVEVLDAVGRVVMSEQCSVMPDIDSAATCPTADTLARKYYVVDGLGRTTAVYLATDFSSSDPYAGMLLERHVFNGQGNPVQIETANGGVVNLAYSGREGGRLVESFEPDGSTIGYSYNKRGQISRRNVSHHSGGRTKYKFKYHRYKLSGDVPGAGELSSVTVSGLENGGKYVKTIEYDIRGNVVSTLFDVEVNATQISYESAVTYDLSDRVTTIAYPAAGAGGALESELVHYDYSSKGTLTGVYSNEAPVPFVIGGKVDFFGRPAILRYGNGVTDRFDYHEKSDNSYLKCIRTTRDTGLLLDGDACSTDMEKDYQSVEIVERDLTGRVIEIDDKLFGNTVAHTAYRRIDYDPLGRLDSVDYVVGGTGSDRETLDYTAWGSVWHRNGAEYLYDDPAHPHAVTSLAGGSANYTYDDAGSRTDDGSRSYRYDGDRRLVEIHDGISSVQRNWYDEGGQRFAKDDAEGFTIYLGPHIELRGDSIVRHFFVGTRRVASDRIESPTALAFGAATSASAGGARAPDVAYEARMLSAELERKLFAGSGLALILSFGLITVVLRDRQRHVRVAALVACAYTFALVPATMMLSRIGQDFGVAHAQPVVGDLVFYHYDHLGSPQVITDKDGDNVEYVRYGAFGEVRDSFTGPPGDVQDVPGDSTSTNVGFTGHEPDEATGLLYFGSRFYDPATTAFLSVDPANQFVSPYAYAGYEPFNGVDPDGNFLQLIAAIGIGVSAMFAIASVVTALIDAGVEGGDLGDVLLAGAIIGASAVLTMGAGVVANELIASAAARAAFGQVMAVAQFSNAVHDGMTLAAVQQAFGFTASFDAGGAPDPGKPEVRQSEFVAARASSSGALNTGHSLSPGEVMMDLGKTPADTSSAMQDEVSGPTGRSNSRRPVRPTAAQAASPQNGVNATYEGRPSPAYGSVDGFADAFSGISDTLAFASDTSGYAAFGATVANPRAVKPLVVVLFVTGLLSVGAEMIANRARGLGFLEGEVKLKIAGLAVSKALGAVGKKLSGTALRSVQGLDFSVSVILDQTGRYVGSP